jgi:Zn-dependent M28 family amino/carboxypeptidase
VIVLGAHYDTVGGSPGANDNGTGLASVLELARRFAGQPQHHTLRFVAFVNEEPPFFQTEEMGSLVYARAARERATASSACCRSRRWVTTRTSRAASSTLTRSGSSSPTSATSSASWATPNRRAGAAIHAAFAADGDFPIQAAPMRADLPGAGWSDHWSFWQAGYPAVMVTDTAPFRYPWYHTAEDTPDKVDFERLAAVVDGLEAVIRALAAG